MSRQGFVAYLLRVDGYLDSVDDQFEVIHSVLKGTLLSEHRITEQVSDLTIGKFLMLSCLTRDYKFGSVQVLQKCLTILKFVIRGFVLVEALDKRSDELTDGLASVNLQKFVQRGKCTPFNTVAELAALLQGMSNGAPHVPKVHWLDPVHHKVLGVRNMQIALTDIAFAAKQLIQQATKTLKTLECGLPVTHSQVSEMLKNATDNLESTETGYWFGSSFGEEPQTLLLRWVLGNGNLAERFYGEGKSVTYGKYIDLVEQMEGLLLVLLHVAAGMPARATEYGPLLLRNSSTELRSIVLVQGELVMLQRYGKTRNTTQKDRVVARYLPSALTELFFRYYVYVRPFVQLLSSR